MQRPMLDPRTKTAAVLFDNGEAYVNELVDGSVRISVRAFGVATRFPARHALYEAAREARSTGAVYSVMAEHGPSAGRMGVAL